MFKRALLILTFSAVLVFSACDSELNAPPVVSEVNSTATQESRDASIAEPALLISEVLTGVDGNNNNDFIELYNTAAEKPLNLKGWSLWFRLSDSSEESLVYHWSESALVPPKGHYLLVYENQDVGVAADATMRTPMIPQSGGLQLRRMDNTVADSLSWGQGPKEFAEGVAASGMKIGSSLERGPGRMEGNGFDSNDNAADFTFSSPNPQNIGSPSVDGVGLALSVAAPPSVLPGDQFSYELSLENQTGQVVNGVTVQFPLSEDVAVVQVSAGIEILDQAKFWELDDSVQVALWDIGSLDVAESVSASITVSTPWTYLDVVASNYSAQAEDWSIPVLGSPVFTSVEGGTVPIGVLGDLVGEKLVIEGTATMYTGGYYAGSGNVKFYLEDETGGVQVWVPGGEGEVVVQIGDLVQVAGQLEIYRGALELVVNDPSDVEIARDAVGDSELTPKTASITDAANNPGLAGKLIQIEGVVSRNEEFSYSYELDLLDESGGLITLYVDKRTNINVEAIENGQHYRAAGILEIYDTRQQLYPRIQEDLERVFPPVLSLDLDAPNTVISGEQVQITLTAVNYTPDPLMNVVITATMPSAGVQFVGASEGAAISGGNIVWNIPDLAGEGNAVSVNYTFQAVAEDGFLVLDGMETSAKEWSDPVEVDPYYVFIGDAVPVWAIQGVSSRSPYTFSPVSTAGTVTGVFPDLGGFWIQEAETDLDPLTSSGLFINTGDLEIRAAPGNIVRVSGVVRETYQQTQVQVSDPADIVILEVGSALPSSVELDPPPDEAASNAYYESLEGMLVQVSGPAVAVAPTSGYGEYVLVLKKQGVERLWQGETSHNGLAIMVDDGSSMVHEERTTLPYAINTGDLVSELIGPLAYTYGRYKIEPIVQPRVSSADVSLPALPPANPEEFSIMTWNAENLFDVLDPHPSDPPKPGIRSYKVSVAKVANTILAAGAPTIVGLQEVENIDILEDIAEHESLTGFHYQPFLIEGTDSRYIDNGYLVRGDVAEVVAVQQHVAPDGLTSRPPLEIEVEIKNSPRPFRLFVLNNHFTSMSGGEGATEPRRLAQAAWNTIVLETILGKNPDGYAAVMGDLNSYYDSPPLDALRDAGLIHVFEVDPEAGWYSYIYQGASQTIDHILVTPRLYDLIQRVDVLHVNADFAPPSVDDESPLRKSDHDPIIVVFSIPE